MLAWLPPVAVGLGAGILSGTFGVGGGVLTTPALRLLLGSSAIMAVGTPLPVMIPTAVTAAVAYARQDLADVSGGIALGVWGAITAVGGAWLSDIAGGPVVLLVTSVLILYMALDMVVHAVRKGASRPVLTHDHPHRVVGLAVLGVATGLYSGFLGLGGGFVLVPMLVRWFGYPIKRAIGTSLVTISILAVPGTIAHAWLGHVDYHLAFLLALGVVPGAVIGARLTSLASDRTMKIAFACLLLLSGVWLAANEVLQVMS